MIEVGRIMKLPKLYAPVMLKFWTLRNSIGPNLGVIFDCDAQVVRKCRRVRTSDGWKWQIVDLRYFLEWDHDAKTDQEILDMHGAEIKYEPAA